MAYYLILVKYIGTPWLMGPSHKPPILLRKASHTVWEACGRGYQQPGSPSKFHGFSRNIEVGIVVGEDMESEDLTKILSVENNKSCTGEIG